MGLLLPVCICSVLTTAVGSTSDDIPAKIIIPPSPTSCTETVDLSVKMECVANARFYISHCCSQVLHRRNAQLMALKITLVNDVFFN